VREGGFHRPGEALADAIRIQDAKVIAKDLRIMSPSLDTERVEAIEPFQAEFVTCHNNAVPDLAQIEVKDGGSHHATAFRSMPRSRACAR
jgi:hypothetical protein